MFQKCFSYLIYLYITIKFAIVKLFNYTLHFLHYIRSSDPLTFNTKPIHLIHNVQTSKKKLYAILFDFTPAQHPQIAPNHNRISAIDYSNLRWRQKEGAHTKLVHSRIEWRYVICVYDSTTKLLRIYRKENTCYLNGEYIRYSQQARIQTYYF